MAQRYGRRGEETVNAFGPTVAVSMLGVGGIDPAILPPLRVCVHCRGYYHTGSYSTHCRLAPWHVFRRARDHRRG